MEYIFDTKEKYIGFLEELSRYCDELCIIEDIDIDTGFWEQMEPYMTEYNWARKFPGHGKSDNLKVLKYPLNNNVINVLSKYDSFLDIGYDYTFDEGIDMAFYKKDKLFFFIVNHEDMCYLEDFAESYFNETIKKFGIKRR